MEVNALFLMLNIFRSLMIIHSSECFSQIMCVSQRHIFFCQNLTYRFKLWVPFTGAKQC